MNIKSVINKWNVISVSAASLAAAGLILTLPAMGSNKPPAVSQVSALSSASTAVSASSVPQSITELMANVPGPNAGQGSPIHTAIHRLMSSVDGSQTDIYAYPTTSGSVCVIASDVVPVGTCVEHFDRKAMPIGADIYVERGRAPTLFAVVPDDCVGVDVIVNGEARQGILANSAVFYQAEAGTAPSAITGVVAHFQDGTSSTQKFVLLDS